MQVGVHCPRGFISHEECRRCALDPLHPCDYTPDVLESMRIDYDDEDREPGVDSFTPTRILGCARQPLLMGQGDYYVDVDQAYAMFRGNMVHSLVEKSRYPGATAVIREQRMKTTVDTRYGPQVFSAKPDIIVVKEIKPVSREVFIKVVDYKSTGDIRHDMLEAKMDHQWQVNMYAWVASRVLPDVLDLPGAQVVVDEVEIAYFAMRKMRRFTSAGERQTKGKRLSVSPLRYETITLRPLMLLPMPAVGAFVRGKIEERIEAKEELPDILEGEQAWRCNYCPVRELCYRIGNVRSGEEAA